MDHFTLRPAAGVMPLLTTDVREPVGRPCGTVMPRYQNLESPDRRFLRGYRYDLWAAQEHFEHAFTTPGFGRAFKRTVRTRIPTRVAMGAQGECLPRYENHVRLDAQKVDDWGIPVAHISASYGEHEQAQARAMAADLNEMVHAMRVEDMTEARPEPSTFGLNIHEVGTARMGNDPKTAVLNRYNQAHEVKNLFVTDGACFPSQGPYEPTLTIMAVTVRACEYLVDEYRRGGLS
jgi:choline dehydrogenase-like flavoprotein